MAGFAGVLNGMIDFATHVPGVSGSYNTSTYGDAENASLLQPIAPNYVPLLYPHFVASMQWDKEQKFFDAISMGGSHGQQTVSFYHICHYLPVAGKPDWMKLMPSEADLIDSYRATLEAIPWFTGGANPSIHSAYDVTVKTTRLQLLKIQHHVIIFTHKVELFT